MCSPFQGFHSQTGSKDVKFKILHLNTVTNKDVRLPLKRYSENSMQGLILEEISRKKKMYCYYCLTFIILKSVVFKALKFSGYKC